MRLSRMMINSCRLLLALPLVLILLRTGAQGQATVTTLRIGLQTAQSEVRLQGTVPVRLLTGGTTTDVPADQILVCTKSDKGLSIADAQGGVLLATDGPVRISPTPPPATTEDALPAPALIRLLGPTRHYDGKVDRPYRGDFEISLRNDGLTVVNRVNLEDYLCGVVSSEMGAGYPPEALKAQAIAARTYAVKHLGRCAAQGFDLDDTPRCQVYGGYLSEDPRTTKAVNETAGQVLTYDGQLIDAVYSSTCGGFTESAEDAWGKHVPYLVSVSDAADTRAQAPQSEDEWAAYCKTAKPLNCLQPKYAKVEAFRWVRLVTRKELEAALPENYRVGTLQNIVPVTRGQSGRITALRLVGSERSIVIESESRIRAALGAREMRSSAFTVDSYRDDTGTPIVFAFWGAGWGHGLGMCQVGAVGLAGQGWTYDKILLHYYRGAAITRQ